MTNFGICVVDIWMGGVGEFAHEARLLLRVELLDGQGGDVHAPLGEVLQGRVVTCRRVQHYVVI